MIKRLMFTGVLSVCGALSVSAATYYIAPSGSDGGIGSSLSPFKTLSHAFSVGSGGDTFILKDGTYSYPGSELNTVDSGSSVAYTVVKAENDGGAVITVTGALSLPTTNPMKQYVRFEGLKFRNADQKEIHGNHLKFMRCGFRGGPSAGNTANTVVGGNDDQTLTRHVLLEDCWFWGPGGRYKLIVFNAENIVVRRVVIRDDAGWNDSPNTGNPEACFAIYNSSACEVQNLVLVDSDQDYYEYGQAFYFIHNPNANPDHAVRGNRLRGIVIINTKAVGFRADAAESTDNSLEDAVVVNSEDWGYSWGSNSNTTFTANRVAAIRKGTPFTFASGSGGYGYWGSGGGITLTNSIIANFSTGPDYNGISTSYFDTYNNDSTTSGTGQKTYNPESNGWRYPVRIESASNLKSAGTGGQIGPQIVNQIGVSGALWGESGYNTDTGEPLWPWPSEARVVADLCADSSRGFCARGSLTQYVWEVFGNTSPLPDPTFPPTGSSTGSDTGTGTDSQINAGSGVSPDNLKPGVTFLMPHSSTGSRATFGDEANEVVIQNDRGQMVFHQTKTGNSNIVWDAKMSDGHVVESGAYLCKIRGSSGKVVFHLLTVVK